MKKKYKRFLTIETTIAFIIIILFFFINSKYIYLIPNCFIKTNLGILCPGCGGTTCFINFLKGNFLDAAKAHIIFFLTILYGLVLNFVYIINTFMDKKILKRIYPRMNYLYIWLIMFLIFEIIRNI